jgi:alpha-N-acetylglucosaminidase
MGEDAARGVLQRTLGDRAEEFTLLCLPSDDGLDTYEVEAHRGRVEIRGTSAVALCRGAYEYLKRACHVQVSWTPSTLELPRRLPDFDRQGTTSPHRLRYYLSVCTFGYSTPWWDWPRWEREIDWMALHGLNMPLALGGQELIWQRVFRRFGLDEKEIRAHFSGPAYLPWHRLGNLNGHLGPLPQSWIDDQADLQRRILHRERELGMKPVVPGFSGFVPPGFAKAHPEVTLFSAEAWAGFGPTTFVDPRHPVFFELGRQFLHEYRQEFGPVQHYLCETFAEQRPQFGHEDDLDDLRAIGRATWETLLQGDPDAHWVMQGWPFYFDRAYWRPDRTAALFEAVPEGRLIVVDQATEELEVWREQPTVRQKGWLHGVVHNYGQSTVLQGDLQAFADRAWAATQDPDRGNLLGMAIAPEGIDQNPVVYELLTDVMWSGDRIDMARWIDDYAHSRYGGAPEPIREAWSLLLQSVYGPPGPLSLRYTWRFRPQDQALIPAIDAEKIGRSAHLLAQAAPDMGASPHFERDLIDVVKTWLGAQADQALASSDRCAFFAILADLDRLMAVRPEHRLSTWIAAARAKGRDRQEADLYERNARTLLTTWGGPYLFDYAVREWAGLVADFHGERWRLYFEALDRGAYPSLDAWEARWAASARLPAESPPEDAGRLVAELLARHRSDGAPETNAPVPARHGPLPLEELDGVTGFVVDFNKPQPVCGVAVVPTFGQGCRADYALELSSDGNPWAPVPGPGHSTVRSARFLFAPREIDALRVKIRLHSGSPEQKFSVLVFPAGGA